MEAIDVLGDAGTMAPLTIVGDSRRESPWRGPVSKEIRDSYELALEQRSDLSVVVAGLDGFRNVIERVGPAEGDAVLDAFAACLGRGIAGVTRLFGDQFIGVLPGADATRASALAEALRGDVAGGALTAAGKVTASFGVAAHPDSVRSVEELVYGAQAAMYWAKAKGGNRVDYWGEMIGAGTSKRPSAANDPVTALAIAVERKIRAEPGQLARSAWYAREVAVEMGIGHREQELIKSAALLHDVGKLAVPDQILQKPGSLNGREMAVVQAHPAVGAEIASRIPGLAETAPIIAHHHENFDGSGYPDGLAGESIPLISRIILVSDAVDAMTTHRPHRSVISLQEALGELDRCCGRQFDKRVVDAFTTIVNRRGLRALHWSQIRPQSNLT